MSGANNEIAWNSQALQPGDWLLIPAGCRHRVAETGPDTVWLAVHVAA